MIPLPIFAFLMGSAVGSFINAAVFRIRWPHEGSLLTERSHCPRCHSTLPWYDLVPVLSFFILGRRCRFCHKPISWQYPAVELATAVLFLLATIFPEPVEGFPLAFDSAQAIIELFIRWFSISVLLFLFVFDLRYGLLPDKVTIPATIIVFFSSLAIQYIHGSWSSSWMIWYVAAILLGASFFALQHFLSRGRWVGGGDIRMGALIGAIAGWPGVLLVILLAYVIGSLVAVPLVLTGKKRLKGDTLPLGPLLATATLITMFFGSRILDAFLYPYRLL